MTDDEKRAAAEALRHLESTWRAAFDAALALGKVSKWGSVASRAYKLRDAADSLRADIHVKMRRPGVSARAARISPAYFADVPKIEGRDTPSPWERGYTEDGERP